MNKIIIVGHPQANIESVEELLVASGMAHALPSRRDGLRPQEIGAILNKAHGAVPVERLQDAQELQQIEVAPVWQGMVFDLMLSNLDQPLWGWADTQAIYLLNYWKEQDPKIVFVLVYDEPHTALTRLSLQEATASEAELQRRLDAWVAYNSALLQFYLRNPQRSVLVHAQQVKPSAKRYLQDLSERIAAPLQLESHDLPAVSVVDVAAPDTVAAMLVDAQVEVLISLLMQANPKAQALYAELQAASTLPFNMDKQGIVALTNLGDSRAPYRAWQACLVQQQRIQELGQRIQGTSAERDELRKQVEQIQKNLERVFQQTRAQNTQYAQTLKDAERRAQAQLNEQAQQLAIAQSQQQKAVQENDLLLSQLALVQEKLEKANAQLQAMQTLEQDTRKRLEEQAQQLVASQNQQKYIAQENGLLLTQLHQIQEELESYHQKDKEKTEALYAAESELRVRTEKLAETQAQLKTERESEQNVQAKLKIYAKELEQARKTIQTQIKQLADVQAKLKQQTIKAKNEDSKNVELHQTNELLLKQLQQVQEELEKYYLENQRLKANQKPKEKVYYGAADRVKNQLSYRLGARMIEQSRSLGGWLSMPFALQAEVKRFRRDQAARQNEKLPPIVKYRDAHEAERVKQHLSYRLGARMIANSKSLTGWLTMPWALRMEIKDFRKTRQ